MEENEIDLPSYVLSVREKLEMTQPELAKFMNCTKGNISAWENGRHEPSYKQLLKMSRESGLPLPHEVIEASSLKETQKRIIESINSIKRQDELDYIRGSLELALGLLSGKKISPNEEETETQVQKERREQPDRRFSESSNNPEGKERRDGKDRRKNNGNKNNEGLRFGKTH